MISSVREKIMEKVLVVGAGMTGASIAAFLRQELPKSTKISIWEKSNGIGGRMSTSRASNIRNSTVDLGAQYISASPLYQQKHSGIYSELIQAGLLMAIDVASIEGHSDKQPDTKHYVVPEGISALVKHFVNKADASVGRQHLVTSITTEGTHVAVTTEQGIKELFDAVVLTMPVPQIFQLKGDIAKFIGEKGIKADLQNVSYSSRFAVGLFFPPGTCLDVPWSAKYIYDNPCVRYVSVDNRKRNKDSADVGPSVCIHTSVPWSMENLEKDKDSAAQEILEHVKALLPWLPKPSEVKGHKWRYSQVDKGFPGSPGCVILSDSPPVLLAGDAFSRGVFDGCLDSALATQQLLLGLDKSKI